ncbi:MAG: hypothetical protein JSW51_02155 [Gemmatimonadota bacterium]|nr:MAG: hypothetical protein JSW51_02155 [Gemmatimonadota bacterium]
MDWNDFTRLLTLLGHSAIVGVAVVTWRRVELPLRKMSASFVAIISVAWAMFYGWLTPTYWGGAEVAKEVQAVAASLSRLAQFVTVLSLFGLLWTMRLGDQRDEQAVEVAARRLQELMGE